jgi:hypothetical protein
MKPPPIAEPGKQQRSAAAAAMRAVAGLRGAVASACGRLGACGVERGGLAMVSVPFRGQVGANGRCVEYSRP